MAAPSGIVWGSTVGGYGRIGIYVDLSHTDTKTTATVEVWFWSKYSVSDNNNTFYFDNLDTTGSATTGINGLAVKTTVDSGDGWSTTNQIKLKSYSYSYNRTKSTAKRYLYAKFLGVDRVGGGMYASTTFTVPTLPTYTIVYNANGGSGAPSSQTKWYGETVKLSNAKPTRTGYEFQGWATSSSGSVSYAAGADYATNSAVTLYAVWKADTYTVKYNANGGSGAPANQTKTYGKTLTLSSTKPTRTNYNFLGWATSASATTAMYAAGGSYTANANATLYAVWELAYRKPRIYSLVVERCTSNNIADDTGTYMRIRFAWETDQPVSSITVSWESVSGSAGYKNIDASGTSGSIINQLIRGASFSTDETYSITVTVKDAVDESSTNTTLNGSILPIDTKAGGDGVSFGKPAELGKSESLGGVGVADFAFDAKFNEPVYGKALGMDRLPAIPANSDLNDYMDPGCYAVQSNAIAATCTNIPVDCAGRLEVWSSTGEGVRLEQWSYLRQRFIPYNSPNAVWEREVTRSADNVWKYYDWWQSSLTPTAAKKVYHEQKVLWGTGLEHGQYMTSGHTATLSEKISEQVTGIDLVFSYYNGADDTNWGWIVHHVPKLLVELEPGEGHTFPLMHRNTGAVGTKYLYINDGSIVGHADNDATGTASNGITYANNKFVLRYVLGV